MSKNNKYSQKIPSGWNSLCYILEGKGVFGSNMKEASQYFVVVIKNDDSELLEVETKGSDCRFILVAGRPIGEKIYQRGPFVMGSQEELDQSMEDYALEKNGFENAHSWRSEIGKLARS